MMSTFNIKSGKINLEVVPTMFNGGEVNIRLPAQLLANSHSGNEVIVEARIRDTVGVMALAMIKDALDRIVDDRKVILYMGYVPYSRQDRVCNAGEALSAKVFCNMINAMNFDLVVTLDNHSDVTTALLDNVQHVPVHFAIGQSRSGLSSKITRGDLTLVAPDAGATKKVDALATYFGAPNDVIQGMKKRDVATGKLSGFSYVGDVGGKDLLIVDDICDGGGTFLGLAEILKSGGANSVSLYVSHGIFSQGMFDLLAMFDKIYTTTSFCTVKENSRVEVIKWLT